MGACALTTEVGTGAKLPPGTRVVLTTSEYDFVRLFRFLEAAPTGIAPNPDGHPVSGTATRHTTARRANGGIRAPCVPTCRKTRPGEGPCCSRLTCVFTRGTGSATFWLSIARTTPVMPGLYGRRPLFEDRPTSVLIKPAQLYARPAVTPGAGLYRSSLTPGSWAPVRRAFDGSRLAPLAGLLSTGPGAPAPASTSAGRSSTI